MDARALVGALDGERERFVRLARLRVASQADAEDIVQRALSRAVEHAGSVQDPARARAWFYRILRHAIADHHRARRSDPARQASAVDPDELPATGAGPARTPCGCSLRLLAELRPAYAEVLRRVDVDGESPEAVATSLGITSGNLYVRLHRARASLRDDVKHYCGVSSHRSCLDCSCDEHHRCGA